MKKNSRRRSSNRPGFSLAEVLVATLLLGILGGAMARMLVEQMRLFDGISATRGARSAARNSMNVLLADLRTVQDQNAVTAAASNGKSITVRVPYMFGVYCGNAGGNSIVSMLPTDSATVAFAKYAGYGWRARVAGTYTIVSTTTLPTASASALCTATAGIKQLSINGRTGSTYEISPSINAQTAKGSAVFFFQTVTYSFASSTLFSGKVGLWRSVSGGVTEELMAPFDTSARFKFYTSGADESTIAPPGTLDNIIGLDLVLNAVAPRTPTGRTGPPQSKMVTSVFFKNVR